MKYKVMVPVVFCQVEAMLFTLLTKVGERADGKVGVAGLRSAVVVVSLFP